MTNRRSDNLDALPFADTADQDPAALPFTEEAPAAPATLEDELEPVLEAYTARLAEHRTNLDAYSFAPDRARRSGVKGFTTCTCGHEAKTSRGLGIHIAAAAKRASKLYDTEAAAVIRARLAR